MTAGKKAMLPVIRKYFSRNHLEVRKITRQVGLGNKEFIRKRNGTYGDCIYMPLRYWRATR